MNATDKRNLTLNGQDIQKMNEAIKQKIHYKTPPSAATKVVSINGLNSVWKWNEKKSDYVSGKNTLTNYLIAVAKTIGNKIEIV